MRAHGEKGGTKGQMEGGTLGGQSIQAKGWAQAWPTALACAHTEKLLTRPVFLTVVGEFIGGVSRRLHREESRPTFVLGIANSVPGSAPCAFWIETLEVCRGSTTAAINHCKLRMCETLQSKLCTAPPTAPRSLQDILACWTGANTGNRCDVRTQKPQGKSVTIVSTTNAKHAKYLCRGKKR